MSDADPVPILRVIKGDPSEEELAALVTAVAARLAATGIDATTPVAPRSEWGAHGRKLRGTHRHGPAAWRASGWPR